MSRERVPTVGTRPADGHDGVSHVNKSQDLQERRSELRDCVQQALSAGSLSLLQPLLEQQHPTDLAEVLGLLDDVDRQTVLGHLSEAATAQVVAELDPSAVRGVAEGLDDERFADLVEQMDPDDAADVLGDLSDEQSEKVLEHMEQDGAREVRALLTYDEHTAGGIMTSRLVSCSQTDTVADAVNRLRSWSEQEEEIHYLYVVDDEQRLLGTVPLKRLVVAAADSSLSHITSRDPIVVHTGADQEEIAQLFTEYGLVALPVVDGDDRLVGRVTFDDAVDVIREEATEDIYEMAALVSEAFERSSVLGAIRGRLPWLLVCLVGTLLSGAVIDAFSESLTGMGILFVFVPAIMAMGGNAGIQTSTVTVRGLATGNLRPADAGLSLLREFRIATGVGKLIAVLVFAVAYLWSGSLVVAACVGLAMVSAIVLSALMGAVIPLMFRRLGIDAAVASGPLITTLNDAVSLFIYFSIAVALAHRWGA